MAKTSKKPAKAKRTPPPANNAPIGNITKSAPNKTVGLNLSISAELRKDFKAFAVQQEKSMAELFGIMFEEFKASYQ